MTAFVVEAQASSMPNEALQGSPILLSPVDHRSMTLSSKRVWSGRLWYGGYGREKSRIGGPRLG
jgi:hypothetical protein